MLLAPGDLDTGDLVGEPRVLFFVTYDEAWFLAHDGAQIPAALTLVTWPEGDRVEGRVHMVDHVDGVGPNRFEFVPAVPLEQRWYAVRFDLTPFGDRWSRIAPLQDPDVRTGTILQRFYHGSLPLLDAALWEDGDPGARFHFIGLTARESLMFAPGVSRLEDLVQIRVDGEIIPTVYRSDNGLEADLHNSILNFACPDCTAASELEIRVAPGLVSLTGVPLRDSQGRTDLVIHWTPLLEGDGAHAPREPSAAVLAIRGDAR